MTRWALPFGQGQGHASQGILPSAAVPVHDPEAFDELKHQLGQNCALVVLFVASSADVQAVVDAAAQAWPDQDVIGCTTAGEIAPGAGYLEDHILALGFPSKHFACRLLTFDDLSEVNTLATIRQTVQARTQLVEHGASFGNEFAFLLVDGLSRREDALASALSAGLGNVPMFGGSAGDGTRFDRSLVFARGKVRENAAVLALLRTNCALKVFSLNHFSPTQRRMVVTAAEPSQRLVQEINAEPAARELARILGKSPEQVDTFTFAENPMVVRFGDTHHVRAIKRVTAEGYLEFFSAIDVGLVLTVAEGAPIVDHLKEEFGALCTPRKPDAVLAFDCILRRIEAGQNQLIGRLGAVLQEYGVAGFSTYGEQFGGMHVNQTMTGVALYAPSDEEHAGLPWDGHAAGAHVR